MLIRISLLLLILCSNSYAETSVTRVNAPRNATYITQTSDGLLTAEQSIGSLATGYLKGATTTGVVSSQAVPIPVADGGTGVTSSTGTTNVVLSNSPTLVTPVLGVASAISLKSTGSANSNATVNKILYGETTDAATAVSLTTDGQAGGASNQIAVPTNTALSVVLNICVKQSGSASAKQMLRQFIVSNNGGTTAVQGTVTTLGTDVGTAGLTTVTTTITADDTNDVINVAVNGVVATNLRYTAYAVSTETIYA